MARARALNIIKRGIRLYYGVGGRETTGAKVQDTVTNRSQRQDYQATHLEEGLVQVQVQD